MQRVPKPSRPIAPTLAVSLLLVLSLLAQGNLLLGHFHAPDAPSSAPLVLAEPGAVPSPEPLDREPDALECEICGALSLCRAVSFGSAPDSTHAVLAVSRALTPPAATAHSAHERTGRSPRAPPLSIV